MTPDCPVRRGRAWCHTGTHPVRPAAVPGIEVENVATTAKTLPGFPRSVAAHAGRRVRGGAGWRAHRRLMLQKLRRVRTPRPTRVPAAPISSAVECMGTSQGTAASGIVI
ncbi:hypothetical protein GCM10010251_44380 [Streptomyces aurantiogriseus]|uniref:Uncharacterized protein n=1 Tax=Streptomyces aurantiogriseus TaxID=66870 RepID=A0A918FBA4_9ACTN|nr:hypothetical protein GCM10010251_44380 [Streptomyces aurantiogriseus]